MRIAHVTATFPPYQGGTGNVAYYNARELAKRGHEVQVFTAGTLGKSSEETVSGFEVHRLDPVYQVGNAPILLGLAGRLRDFDIIHLHHVFILGAEMVRYSTWRSGTPWVVSIHNDLIGDGIRGPLFASYQSVSARLSIRHADLLCAISLDHFIASKLAASLGEKRPPVVELPNGVDTDLFCPAEGDSTRQRYGIPHTAKLALFVAALDRAHYYKGLDRLLEAWDEVDRQHWLLIVGDGDMRKSYERKANELGVAKRAVFAGAVYNEKLPEFYRAADVTVFPSTIPESFGLVLIESMACGTPVIASDFPGVRRVVSPLADGFLVEAGNVGSLAAQLNHALSLSPERRKQMGTNGRRKAVREFDWQNCGERLENYYLQLLQGNLHDAMVGNFS